METVEGRKGRYGLEGIALFLTLTFFIRVIGDMVRRYTSGRLIERSPDIEVDVIWTRVVDALDYVERLLGGS